MPSSKYPILYVDDEPENLVTFRYAVEDRFPVLTAGSGAEALDLLEREAVAVLLSDQRMPGMSGVELCEAARKRRPDVVRIIITAYSDLQVAVDAINRGQVARYLTKPWRDDELLDVLTASVELASLQQTVREMQVRLLRQGEPVAVAALREEVARQLQVPVEALHINVEQVRDLIAAGRHIQADPERARELFDTALAAHNEMDVPLATLRQMREQLARRERLDAPPRPAMADASRVVRAIVQLLGGSLGSGVELEAVLRSSPVVPMEPAELGHLLTELVGNASRATADRPNVITLSVAERDGGAEIVVSDTGRGIAPDRLERIFDAHVSEDARRKGLGLALVRQLVTGAGGSVQVEGAPGHGARFVVRFPPPRDLLSEGS